MNFRRCLIVALQPCTFPHVLFLVFEMGNGCACARARCVCVRVLASHPPMRWEFDAHVCVRVRMYADIAFLYSSGSFLRLGAPSWPSRHYAGLPTWEELDEASKTDNRRTSQSAHELHKVYDRTFVGMSVPRTFPGSSHQEIFAIASNA